MLTQEQIKNLKPGDKLALSHPLIFREYDSENDELLAINNGEYIYFHAVDVELPRTPPAHSATLSTTWSSQSTTTTRLFKKGDKVKLTKWNGRICEKFFREGICCGENLTVVRDEDCFLNVTVRIGKVIEKAILSPFLELVTPVEELEPYKLIDSPNTYNIVRDSAMVMTIHKKSHPNAKAAAEAECDRLNEEYGKEQNNG